MASSRRCETRWLWNACGPPVPIDALVFETGAVRFSVHARRHTRPEPDVTTALRGQHRLWLEVDGIEGSAVFDQAQSNL